MQSDRHRLGIVACLLSTSLATAAGATERPCIEARSGERFAVAVETDGMTWRIENASGSLLGKIELTCRVKATDSGGVAVPLAASHKVCLGDQVPSLGGSTECIVQKILIPGALSWWDREEELAGFTPSEIDDTLIGSGRWFWLVGHVQKEGYNWREGEFAVAEGPKKVKVTYAAARGLYLAILQDSECTAALGELMSGAFTAHFVDVHRTLSPAPPIVETLKQRLHCEMTK